MNKSSFLKVKVAVISFLRAKKLIPDVWYQCELDLAKEESKDLADFFNKHKSPK